MKTKSISVITGGAGFIGSHLCESLLAEGHEVYSLDNFVTGRKQNLTSFVNNKSFHSVVTDVTKKLPNLLSHLPQIDYIYHFASPASPPQYRKLSIETLLVNSIGTYQVLNLALKTGARVLIASTSEVYGDPLVHPQPEDYNGNVNPIGLRACYDEAKRFSESLAIEYFRKFKLDTRIVRIFNTYGPRMEKDDGRVISNFVVQALSGRDLTIYGDGTQTRSFCYISDLIRGLNLFMTKKGLSGEVINLGNTNEMPVLEIAKLVQSATKTSSQIRFTGSRLGEDPQRRRPDLSKAIRLLNWQPRVSIQDGLEKTIAYFKSL